MLFFEWKILPVPILGLAPMADYTDLPFGLICKDFGARVIFREMLSAEAIIHHNEKTIKKLKIDKKERPVIQQIFGCDPKIMAEAAKIVCRIAKPDGLDVNMGCPAKKVIKNFHGAALMKEPNLAIKIIQAVKKAVNIPVSVKTRLGWAKPEEILSFAPLLEKAGADLISIHGRTKNQGFEGQANWKIIGQVKKILKIPVLANGGILTPTDIVACLEETKADGVLIARGALGNPWIFQGRRKQDIPFDELAEVILKHARLQIKHYGEYGIILFRKHLMHYFKEIPGGRQWREKLSRVDDLDTLLLSFPPAESAGESSNQR